MAYVANMDEDEQNKQGGVAPVNNNPVHLAPSSGVGSAGAGGTGAAPQKDAGGQFATLDKYVTANQGQAAPLASRVTNPINDQYNTLNQGNQSTLQNLNSQVTNAPGYTKSDPNVLAQEAANPVSFAGDTNNVKNFQSLLTNSYGGPASAEGDTGFQAQQSKVNQAIAQGQTQTSTDAGRKQLVNQASARPTVGVTAVNNAIVSQDPNALSSIEHAYDPFSNLVSGLSTGAQDINKTIAQEQNDATTSSKAAKDAISGQIGGLNSAVTGTTNDAIAKAQAQQNAINSGIGGLYSQPVDTTATTLNEYGGATTPWYNTTNYSVGNLNTPALQALGISQDQWNALQNQMQLAGTSESRSGHNFGANSPTSQVDLNQFLSEQDPTTAYTNANMATPEQYQQAQAFQNLVGGLNLGTPQLAINQSTAAQAGTAPTNLNSFDYNSALGQATSQEQQARTAAQDEANAISSNADAQHDASAGGWFKQNLGYNPFSGNLKDLIRYNVNPLGKQVQKAAPIAGAVLGGIYGGPAGAGGGASLGQLAGQQGLKDEKKYLNE